MSTVEGTGQGGGKPKKSAKNSEDLEPPRKSWSVVEEQHFISFLYELIETGQKSDNGFRAGYQGTLVKLLNHKMPGAGFVVKHVRSKLTQWKREYALLQTMLNTSGFGWSTTENKIEVPDDVWEEFARVNKDARGKRMRVWPYYEDWCQLFGKDRANGHGAVGVLDMIEEINAEENPPAPGGGLVEDPIMVPGSPVRLLAAGPWDSVGQEMAKVVRIKKEKNPDVAEDSFNSLLTEVQLQNKKKNVGKLYSPPDNVEDRGSAKTNKRQKLLKEKRPKKEEPETFDDPMGPAMTSLLEDAKLTFQNLGQKFEQNLDTEEDVSKKVIAALEQVPELTSESQCFLGLFFMQNASERAFFLQSAPANRKIMAFMILEDKKP